MRPVKHGVYERPAGRITPFQGAPWMARMDHPHQAGASGGDHSKYPFRGEPEVKASHLRCSSVLRMSIVVACLLFIGTSARAAPVGSAFIYQGRMVQGGQPADGAFDFTFTLWDSAGTGDPPAGGNQIGGVVSNPGTVVSQGLFTVQVNEAGEFGPNEFPGEARWLQITVNGTPLSPRQPLMATPYAQYAVKAGPSPLSIPFDGEANVAIQALIDLENTRTTSNAYAGIFRVRSPVDNSRALTGLATGASGLTYGVWGEAISAGGVGVYGESAGDGVYGKSTATSGTGHGVRGETASVTGYAGYFVGGRNYFSGNVGIGIDTPISSLHAQAPQAVARMVSTGALNGSVLVLQNNTASPNYLGAINFASAGSTPGQIGYLPSHDMAFRVNGVEQMRIDDDGDLGVGTASPTARLHVSGKPGAPAVRAVQANSTGAGAEFSVQNAGNSSDALRGVHFGNQSGVYGETNTGIGVEGVATATSGITFGVVGNAHSPNGRGVYGVAGFSEVGATSYGILGEELPGPNFGIAIYAIGEVGATGGKSFRIDHPDDPENRYLLHYATESPEILNFYSGNVILNASGEALVYLPAYFAKINKDPRYTLTPVGAAMPNLHVAEEISEKALQAGESAGPDKMAPICSFRISGGVAGAKVSWEVKALRNDHWVRDRGAPEEVEKQGVERGKYQHPEFYSQPPEKGMNYAARSRVASVAR